MGNSPRTSAQPLTTIADVAARLGISTKTVRRRIADGTITAHRIGTRMIRIDPVEAEQKLLRPLSSGR